MKRLLRPVLGACITVFFLYLLLWHLDWQKLSAVLRTVTLPPLLLALVVLAVDFFLRIVRWWKMLRALEPALPLNNCVGPYLASIAINNVMPLRAGDVVRVMGFRDQLRSSGMQVLGTLVIERLLDLLVLLAIFFIGLVPVSAGVFPQSFVQFASGAALVGVVMLLVLIFLPHTVHGGMVWLVGRLRPRTGPQNDKVFTWIEQFFDALSLLRSRRLTTELLLLSMLAWFLEGTVFACVAWAILGSAPIGGTFFALATGVLSTLLPSAPGYVGTFDFFTMQGLMAYGLTREHATGFALLVHAVLWLPLTAIGLLCFLSLGNRKNSRDVESRRKNSLSRE